MAFVDDNFGINVFNDSVMRQRLPKETYKTLHKTIDEGRRLDPQVASVVANAMKDWALERGATHYTHWFQPLNSVTAEKHDAFTPGIRLPMPLSRNMSFVFPRHIVPTAVKLLIKKHLCFVPWKH